MSIFVLAGAGFEPFTHWAIWRFLLEGLWLSVQIAAYAIVLSLLVGMLMAVGRLAPSRAVRWLAGTYVEVFRATPLLLLIFFVFFGIGRLDLSFLRGLPLLSGLVDNRGDLNSIPAVVIALTLYNSAVVAEIVRAGILSISKGIIEASRALGLTYLQSMRFVALPMALRRMAPGLVSQLITLFKDTSLASIISILELLRRGRLIYDSPVYNNTLEVLLVVSIMYFIPCYALSLLAQRLEKGPEQQGVHVLVPAAISADASVPLR
jgi:His/Glu/Gln/Arg/opine family amino acid ABC transporter permease subunit